MEGNRRELEESGGQLDGRGGELKVRKADLGS